MAIIGTVWYAFLAMIGLTNLPEKSSTPFIDPAQVISSEGACPDDVKCSFACHEDPRFKTKGACVGPDRTLCSCERSYYTTDQHRNAEASDCIEKECKEKCLKGRVPLIGRCLKGMCKCVIYAAQS